MARKERKDKPYARVESDGAVLNTQALELHQLLELDGKLLRHDGGICGGVASFR